MRRDGGSRILNLGNGNGFSNREIIHAVEKASGRKLEPREGERRAGDPAVLVAGSEKAARELGWKPRFPSVDAMVETAWRWHSAHPYGYSGKPG